MNTNMQLPPALKRGLQTNRLKKSLTKNSRTVLIVILIILLFAISTMGALFVLPHRNTANQNTVKVVGQVSFVSSGQLYVNNNQGINDQVLVDLHNVPAPTSGKSYYAWLLGDENQTDIVTVALGQLNVIQGNAHLLYPGDPAHTNLLNDMSRFLITEEDANTMPTDPLLDQSSWRYYAEIYQKPSLKDPNHFSLLDHLRHLVVQAPELKALGLSGGLGVWLLRNVQVISAWALNARQRWESQSVDSIRHQLANILYYIDGECVQADFQGVPQDQPTTPENQTIARIAHFALLNPCIQEEQEQAELLKQVFQHTPHNYIDHLLFHMAGVIVSPGATPSQHAVALQINTAINNVRNWLGQMRQDALQLVHMSDEQLTSPSALAILGDLDSQARYAFAGRTDPNTGDTQEGAAWISDNIERLTTMDILPYSSH